MKITKAEWFLAAFIVVLGYIFSSKKVLLTLNGYSPLKLLIISYVVYFGSLMFLARRHDGIFIWKLHIDRPLQVIGSIMIIFSFFLVLNMENPYVQFTTNGNLDGASHVFYGTEDAVTWDFWSHYIPPVPENIERLRLLTFVFTPGILTLLGSLLVSGRIDF